MAKDSPTAKATSRQRRDAPKEENPRSFSFLKHKITSTYKFSLNIVYAATALHTTNVRIAQKISIRDR